MNPVETSHPYTHDVTVAVMAAVSFFSSNTLIAFGTVVYIFLRCYGEWLSILIKRRDILNQGAPK